MILEYRKRIIELPRGSLVIRERNGRKYCYLRYREGKKVIQKYVGTIEQEKIIYSKIEEREHLMKIVKMLEEENKCIGKMEAIK